MPLRRSEKAPALPYLTTSIEMSMRPKVDAVLAALAESRDYADFEARLSALDLGATDNILIQRLTADGVRAWADGAESRLEAGHD